MEDYNDKVKVSSKKRPRKPKRLEFVGWGSKNLIEFLESLGKDTTNKISENEVTTIITRYIRDKTRGNPPPKKRKTVDCDHKLHLLFGCKKIKLIKIPELLEKHYVENQDDSEYDYYLYSQEDDKQGRWSPPPSDKIANPVVEVRKPKGTFAAIVSDNIKLVYLKKSLVQELAKDPETFESKLVGTFVRIKKPSQLVHVTGVKEGNPIDGCFLQVTNYSYNLDDVPSSALSDDDFSQEECEELRQRIKNGCVKRLTVVDMEEKVRMLHEDVTKHWLARELLLLQRRIDQANEKGWRRELSQYLDRRELLEKSEEQSRLLREVPEVVAEELETECVGVGGKTEDDFTAPHPETPLDAHQSEDEQQQLNASPVFSVEQTLETSKLPDGEIQPTWTASVGDKDLHEDVFEPLPPDDEDLHEDVFEPLAGDDKDGHEDVCEPPADGTLQNKDSITDGELNSKTTQQQPSVPAIDLDDEPESQSNPIEIIELSDDDDDDNDEKDNDNRDHQHYDPKKAMWCYEFPKGTTYGPFSLLDLKNWSDAEYFVDVPDFKVWKEGEGIESAVLLTKLVPHIKTST